MTTETDGTWFGLLVPYRGHLKEPIKPGQTLIITGLTSQESNRFSVNFHNKSADFSGNDVPLHISVRFDEGKIVLNTFSQCQWGKEERKKIPIKKGDNFDLRIRAHEDKFDVFVNRLHFVEYKYRLPLNEITHFSIDGDLFLSKIHWSGKYYAVPHETGIPSGFTPGKRLMIFGQVEKKAKRFNVNLLHKSGDIAFHFNPRFDEKVIVRNALTLGKWGAEERDRKNVFEKNALFDLFIDNTDEGFKIYINGRHYANFAHRLGDKDVHGLQIQGDVDINGIQMEVVAPPSPVKPDGEPLESNEPFSEVVEKTSIHEEAVNGTDENEKPTPDVQMEGLLTRSMKTFGHGFDRLPFHSMFGHIENDSDAIGFHNFFSRGFFNKHHDVFDLGKYRFCKIDPTTGRIKNCKMGHKMFKFGGCDNRLSDLGKIYLDNIISGRYKKKIVPFIPPKQVPAKPSKPKEPEPMPSKSDESKNEPAKPKEPEEPKLNKPELKPPPAEPEKTESTPAPSPKITLSVVPEASKADVTTPTSPLKPPDVAPVPITESPFVQKRDACLKAKKLFEDPEFPANDNSLYFTRTPGKAIKWLRPGEIVKDPQLIVQGDSRFDCIQGELGDCWFLAAAACLTLRDELFYRVVPPDQSFTENYAGIFRFYIWHYGKWVEVIVDDRLPTYEGKLIFMHSESQNEFWSALLEKAYAKLFGSYEAIDGGMVSEALEDFTGGLIEIHQTKDHLSKPEVLMGLMLKGFEKGSFFSCSIDADPYVKEAKMPNGLIKGHAYSITGIKQITGPKGQTVLIRIRNPWGNANEWKGAWSDGSWEWSSLPEKEREQMQVHFLDDGEFWMAFDDFISEFKKIEICHFSPEIMEELTEMTGIDVHPDELWENFEIDSIWSRKLGTAGGCRNYISSFANNPQYFVMVSADEKSLDTDGKVTIIAAVMQKHRREGAKIGLENLTIGFGAYQIDGPKPEKKLDRRFFETHRSVANTTFINLREVSLQFRVQPGTYVIVPSTFEPNQEAEFLLRIYAEGKMSAGELKA